MSIAALARPRLALALATVTWLAPSGSHAASPGPVETVTRYLELSLDQRCDELWTLYTKATQANLAAWWHRHDRERNDKPQEDSRPQLGILLALGMDDLERDFAIQLLIVGGIDDAHSSFTELAQQHIASDARQRIAVDSFDALGLLGCVELRRRLCTRTEECRCRIHCRCARDHHLGHPKSRVGSVSLGRRAA